MGEEELDEREKRVGPGETFLHSETSEAENIESRPTAGDR